MIPKIHQKIEFDIDPLNRKVVANVTVTFLINDIVYMIPSIGVAKCHPDDEWDEVTGKRLAESRAIQKSMKNLRKWVDSQLDELCRKSRSLTDLFNKASSILSNEESHEFYIKKGI